MSMYTNNIMHYRYFVYACSKEDAYVCLEQQSLQQQAMVSDLSHQLQVHQTNVHSLKEELNLVSRARRACGVQCYK